MGESEQAAHSPTASSGKSKVRSVGFAIGLTILAVLLSAIVGILFAIPLFALGFEFESTSVLVTLFLGGQIGFFAAGYLYARRYGLSIRIARSGRRDFFYAGGGTLAALILASGSGLFWSGSG